MALFILKETRKLTYDIYEIKLEGDIGLTDMPGKFVNIKIDGLFLRRPLSIADLNGDILTLIFKVVGKGTRIMSEYMPGQQLDLLLNLGNGYDIDVKMTSPLLIGGGCGVPPLYYLAKKLIEKGQKPQVILGFNEKEDIFYENEFRQIGCIVHVCTVDGSCGIKGFATKAMDNCCFDYIFCCGPEAMMKAVYEKTDCPGQYSFEERMGCGFGVCMGCTCKTKYGYKRICKDGPVLFKEEILW